MKSDPAHLRALVPALAGRRVAVLGDVILDEYLVGRPSRISREAPVLVLDFGRRFCRPGGAANPAMNIQALGSTAALVAIIGDDPAGQTLVDELQRAGLATSGLLRQADAQTSAKTRLLAEDSSSRQHLVRLDYPASLPTPAARQSLSERLSDALEQADALLVSDYRNGVIDPPTLALARDLGRRRGVPITVDSQGDLFQFVAFDLVKCNQGEAERALGRRLDTETQVEAAGAELIERLEARFLVLTRGPDGLSVFERGGSPTHLPAANRTEVFDVTGAGDTVIAVLTLALVAGATLVEAAELANTAAGIVVRRLGVATTTPDELLAALATRS